MFEDHIKIKIQRECFWAASFQQLKYTALFGAKFSRDYLHMEQYVFLKFGFAWR